MNSDFHYELQISHQTQGRVRVKIPWLRGRPAVAPALERHLALTPHLRPTSVRPITGSVIIHYDAYAVDAPQLVSRLQMAMAGIFSPLLGGGAYILNTLTICAKSGRLLSFHSKDAAAILRETMMESGEAYLSKIPVEVDVASGETRAEK